LHTYSVLYDGDKKRFAKQFESYINKISGQYISQLQSSDILLEIEKIDTVYFWIDQNLKLSYEEYVIFKTFEFMYTEHFAVPQ